MIQTSPLLQRNFHRSSCNVNLLFGIPLSPQETLTDHHAMLTYESEIAFLHKVTRTDLHAMLIDDSEFAFLTKVTLTDHHAMLIYDLEFAFPPK